MAAGRPSGLGGLSALDVVVATLRESSAELEHHVERFASESTVDPESVHQARVATRRMRSNLTVYRGVIDETWSSALRSDLSWLASVLGAVRDADVLHDTLCTLADGLELPDDEVAAAIVSHLGVQREQRRDALRRAATSGDLSEVTARVAEALEVPVPGDLADRRADTVVVVSARRAWIRLDRDARRILREGPDHVAVERLHRLRVRAKRFRYAAEAAAPWEKAARRHARAVRRVQDELGLLHDASMAAAWLRAEVSTVDPATAFVAGRIHGRADDELRRRRRTWVGPWRRASNGERRAWLDVGSDDSPTG